MLDVLLLGAIRRGSENALGQLIDKYSAYVCVVIRNAVGESLTQEDIEEIASDVFFSLWQKAGGVEKIKAWLAATARNKAKNKLRGVRDVLPLETNNLPSYEHEPEDMYISDCERSAMKTAVLLLDAPDREIFMQYYYESKTVGEIAQKAGMTETAIKQRLFRGRKKLKTFLIVQEVFCNG